MVGGGSLFNADTRTKYHHDRDSTVGQFPVNIALRLPSPFGREGHPWAIYGYKEKGRGGCEGTQWRQKKSEKPHKKVFSRIFRCGGFVKNNEIVAEWGSPPTGGNEQVGYFFAFVDVYFCVAKA